MTNGRLAMRTCECDRTGNPAESDIPIMTHIDSGFVNTMVAGTTHAISTMALARSAGAPAKGAAGVPMTEIHAMDGALLVSSALATGNRGDVVLQGTIGTLPYELHLGFVMADGNITVSLELTKPFKAGPFEWTYQMSGLRRDGSGGIVGATGLVPLANALPQSATPMGLSGWCILKCGGITLLGVLVRCLPSLAGGVPGYIACVTSQAGRGAAGIAACIAQKCL